VNFSKNFAKIQRMTLIAVCKIILACSLGGMLFIFLRVLPLLPEFKPKLVPEEKKFFFRLETRINAGRRRIGEKFYRWGRKNAHRIRILVLKIDNFLTSYLKRAREKEIHFEKVHLSRRKKIEKVPKPEKALKRKRSKKRLKKKESK